MPSKPRRVRAEDVQPDLFSADTAPAPPPLASAPVPAKSRKAATPREDAVTMVAAFPSRSLSIATLIAVNVLGRLEFLSFAVIFFLVQALLLVPVMLLTRPTSGAT